MPPISILYQAKKSCSQPEVKVTWRAWNHLDPSLPLARTETTIACMQVGRRRTSSVPSNPSGPDPASGQGLHAREKSGTSSEVQPKPLGLPRHIPSQGRGWHHVQEKPSSFRAPAPASWAQPLCFSLDTGPLIWQGSHCSENPLDPAHTPHSHPPVFALMSPLSIFPFLV